MVNPTSNVPGAKTKMTDSGDLQSRSISWSANKEGSGSAVSGIASLPVGLSAYQDGVVKYISLAAPLTQSDQGNMIKSFDPTRHMVLQTLPMRATLHRDRQIPGRYFPSPSYTEFQRDVLESKPTPRRIIRKFKQREHKTELFPAGSPIKPRTVMEKSTWIANQVYSRGAHSTPDSDKQLLLMAHNDNGLLAMGIPRQYSIPATTQFHDGKNEALLSGCSKTLHNKNGILEVVPPNRTMAAKSKQAA